MRMRLQGAKLFREAGDIAGTVGIGGVRYVYFRSLDVGNLCLALDRRRDLFNSYLILRVAV